MKQNESSYLLVIGGPGGSGSSTIAKRLSEYLDIPRVYAGGIFREKAKDAGFESLEDFLVEVTEKNHYLDNQVDEELVKIAKERDVLIESKIFAPIATVKGIECTSKIWLDADIDVRARRRLNKESSKGKVRDYFRLISIRRDLKKRFDIDKKKFWDLYRVHYDKPEMYYDLVLDTSGLNEEETFNLILKFLKDGGYIKQK